MYLISSPTFGITDNSISGGSGVSEPITVNLALMLIILFL